MFACMWSERPDFLVFSCIDLDPEIIRSQARKKKYKTIKAMEDLRFLLPETCVAWLLQEEPWLLHGVPAHRLEQVLPTLENYNRMIAMQ